VQVIRTDIKEAAYNLQNVSTSNLYMNSLPM
jgi:hypothetical protein